MAQQTVSTYNPEAVFLVIDGIRIDGLSEDGITIEQEAESEVIEGMDSGMTFNFDPSRLAMVTVSLRAASAGARQLNDIRASFEATLRSGAGAPAITGIASDPVNGTSIASGQVFFLNKPMPNLAKQAGEIEFSLAFTNYENAVALLVAP